jgi:predicted transcriptional regulator of viral defense system
MKPSAKEYRKGLSKKESFLISSLAREDRPIFTIDDAKRHVPENTKEVMHSLAKKKWVLPLKRGLYAIVPMEVGVSGADSFVMHSFVIASYLVEPYYIGFWSALNHHGLTEQIPRTTFMATTKAKKPLEILNSEYYFVRLEKKKFFGTEEVEIEKRAVAISTKGKTVADCLDHPEHTGGIDEVARSIYFNKEEIDIEKVFEYGREMGNITILKRLGHILEKTGLLETHQKSFQGFTPSKGFSVLDPLSPRRGTYNSRWGLLVNFELKPEGWMY